MQRYHLITHSELLAECILFRVGKENDPKGKEGLSHFLEHMMFRRDDKNGTMKRMREYGAIYFNGSTSNWRTRYWIYTHPSEKKAWVEFKRMIEKPVFDDYEKEKGTIIEEIRRTKNNPNAYAIQKAMELLLGKRHGVRAAGTEDAVRKISKTDIEKHYSKYYTKGNCVLVTGGRVTPPEVPEPAEGRKIPLKRVRIKPKTGRIILEKRYNQERVVLLWLSPLKGQEADPLSLFSRILSMKNKLLNEIRSKRGWAYAVSARVGINPNYSVLQVNGGIKKGKGEKAASIARKIVENTRITETDVKKAKKIVYYHWLDTLENTMHLTKRYGQEMLLYNRTPEERIESLMLLTKQDVAEVMDSFTEPLELVVK